MERQVPGGYNGRVLRINLTSQMVTTEPINDLFCRKYLGGAGFIAYYLLTEVRPGIDPLSHENKIIFALGPLTGLTLAGCARHTVGAKSPLTGGIAKSEVGEYWGSQFKRAGFDALIVEGKAEQPVYLWIHNGEIEIKDAGHLWGKSTQETQRAIQSELADTKIRVAMIGPGGENLVRYACIMHGLSSAAGRGGMGAIMGSKNLKAVAVRGDNMPPMANSDGVKKMRNWLKENLNLVKAFSDFGTGQSQSAYLKGLLQSNDGRKVIALLDEVAMMDSSSMKPIYDLLKDQAKTGELLAAVVIQKAEKPKPIRYSTIFASGSSYRNSNKVLAPGVPNWLVSGAKLDLAVCPRRHFTFAEDGKVIVLHQELSSTKAKAKHPAKRRRFSDGHLTSP